MPAGDTNTAVSLEKERAGEFGAICEQGKEGKGILDQERGLVTPP